MNRLGVFTLSTMMALGLALLPGSAVSQQKSIKDQLVGAWTLISQETTAPDGAKQQPYGANPKGILIFEGGGQYATMMLRANRPKLSPKSDIRLKATADEFAAAARGFAANFGTWSVDETGKILVRKYQGALIPNNETNETKVSVSITGDDLRLVQTAAAGKTETVYRRAK